MINLSTIKTMLLSLRTKLTSLQDGKISMNLMDFYLNAIIQNFILKEFYHIGIVDHIANSQSDVQGTPQK